MFDKILIANRGEIACRVARDRAAAGHRAPSPSTPTPTPTRCTSPPATRRAASGRRRRARATSTATRILAVAKATGAQAIHPGYGFLSENEAFAAGLRRRRASCSSARRRRRSRAMGSKAAAKPIMGAAGVPLVPGYHGDDQDPALLATRSRAHRLSRC